MDDMNTYQKEYTTKLVRECAECIYTYLLSSLPDSGSEISIGKSELIPDKVRNQSDS